VSHNFPRYTYGFKEALYHTSKSDLCSKGLIISHLSVLGNRASAGWIFPSKSAKIKFWTDKYGKFHQGFMWTDISMLIRETKENFPFWTANFGNSIDTGGL